MADSKQMTGAQLAYEAKRAARAGKSLDHWLDQKRKQQQAVAKQAAPAGAAKESWADSTPDRSRAQAALTPLAAHADWSTEPGKRWVSVARPAAVGWRIVIEPVGRLPTFLTRLLQYAAGIPAVLGVDAPVGLPLAFRKDEFADFPTFLDRLTADSPFFEVCRTPEKISLARPFYPASSRAGARHAELAAGLGVPHFDALRRRCERQTGNRPAAAPLFWTLGANQAGKAAISLWRDLLLPARRSARPPALWPFEGTLAELLQPGRLVIAETYPADALRQLRLRLDGSKRRRSSRKALAGGLQAWMDRLGARAETDLQAEIDSGFGDEADGEDRFDALLGLLALLRVLREPGHDALPEPAIRRWEGWILGQALTDR